jgi:hypothetical protein
MRKKERNGRNAKGKGKEKIPRGDKGRKEK